MGVDCLGKWAVLPGRRFFTFVDLDDPNENTHSLARQSKWEVSCVQWNPHASHAHLFGAACTQRLDLFSWEVGSNKDAVCSMKAHTRNITDIDWSPFDVNVITSCSVDTFTYLWDVRDPKRPSSSFQSVCGVSQVQWNKVTNNLFATAHEGDVRIWDPRKGSQPVVYITAHLSKIHGIDWNPTNEYCFTTSSQDCSAKFWDFNNPRHNKGMLNSGSPVWRARYTPFGEGLVTVVLSQLRRSENNIFVWNNNTLEQPVYQFTGHDDVVLEFQWRKKLENSHDYCLVTWSKDQNLKIWKVDTQIQRLCGHDVDLTETEGTIHDGDIIRSGTPVVNGNTNHIDQSDGRLTHQQPMSLYQEFSLLNKQIPNVTIDKMDGQERHCLLSVGAGKYTASLTINFPSNYPNGAAPSFEITQQTGMGQGFVKKLMKVLKETAQMHVNRNANCLEPCIRQFATVFESMTIEERKTPDSDNFPQMPNPLQHTFISGLYTFQDSYIPFPRTCGAQFNSTGLLVCFGRSRETNKSRDKTPKALSDLAAFTTTNRVRSSQTSTGFPTLFSRSPPTPKPEHVSISNFYIHKRTRTKSRTFKDFAENKFKNGDKAIKKEKKTVKLDPVRIYDSECLLNMYRDLGEKYSTDVSNIEVMCNHNKKEAAAVGRQDLVKLWSLVQVMKNPVLNPSSNPDDGPPWARNTFGRPLLESLMNYYMKIYDVQTLAMLCVVFWDRKCINTTQHTQAPAGLSKSASKASLDYMPANYNPYHTVSSMTGLLRSFTTHIVEIQTRLYTGEIVGNVMHTHMILAIGKPTIYCPIRSDTNLAVQLQEMADGAIQLLLKHLNYMHLKSKLAVQTPVSKVREVRIRSPPKTAHVQSNNTLSLLSQAMVKIRRSNSISEFSFEDYKFSDDADPKEKAEEIEKKQHENYSKMLDPSKYLQYDHYLKVYGDILYRWGLRNKSVEILKFVTIPPEPHSGLEFKVLCHNCGAEVRGVKCERCKIQALKCAICNKGVKGLLNFCLYCGHGGHTNHMMAWFKTEEECPIGCGCRCLNWSCLGLNQVT